MSDFFMEDDILEDDTDNGSVYESDDNTDFSNREYNPYFVDEKKAKKEETISGDDEVLEDDKGFYDEDPEDNEVPEIKGITDEVSGYTYSKMNYPAIFIKSNIQLTVAGFSVLKAMISSVSTENRNIYVYNESAKGVFLIGRLSAMQVMNFYNLVGQDSVRVFLSKEKELIGDYMYVLCQ